MKNETYLLKTLGSGKSLQPAENPGDRKIVELPQVSVLQILAVLCLSLTSAELFKGARFPKRHLPTRDDCPCF